MWIISKNGFVSLVEHSEDPDWLRARARRREHLLHTFASLEDRNIIDFGEQANDYRYHADVPRALAAQALAAAVMDVSYTSHAKEAIAGTDHVMYSAMMGAWQSLYRLQDEPAPALPLWDREPSPSDPAFWRRDPAPTLDDLGDIAGQVGELADKMLATKDPFGAGNHPADPLPVKRWGDGADDCLICGEDLHTGDEYVVLPEDAEFHEPEGPAHVECADDEGWEIEHD